VTTGTGAGLVPRSAAAYRPVTFGGLVVVFVGTTTVGAELVVAATALDGVVVVGARDEGLDFTGNLTNVCPGRSDADLIIAAAAELLNGGELGEIGAMRLLPRLSFPTTCHPPVLIPLTATVIIGGPDAPTGSGPLLLPVPEKETLV
jgi:hypothetical protein